jgi:antitoxin (DNA-binding transcriptional repressor) of toxin-antitoxin stability system
MNMNIASEIINTKQLRLELPRIIRRIAEGQRYLVLHRSKPTFEIIPHRAASVPLPPLEKDPLFRLGALGESTDGASAADHDRFLYGS